MSDPRGETTLAGVGKFFVPLALSGMMMFAGQPIIHAGLARLESPELVLAAYGVAFYVAVLLEAPIIMLLPAANALVCDERAYRLTRNCMAAMNLVLTVITAAVAMWTPAYNLVFISLLRFPEAVAYAAQPAMKVLILWPALIGLRRFYQGILIRYGRTAVVGWGTAGRLVAMIASVIMGVATFPEYGVLVGGVALAVGVLIEALIVVFAARWLLLGGVLEEDCRDAPAASRTVSAFARFYFPLALTMGLRFTARPLMLSGMARSNLAVLSLAAFPVALGTMELLAGHLHMLQQVGVALARDLASLKVVQRFSYMIGGCFSLLLVMVAFTPIATLYHERVIGITGEVLATANLSLKILVAMPILTALQALYQGLLIRRERTVAINIAAFANLVLLVSTVHILARLTPIPGYIIGSIALPAVLLCEAGVLWWCSRSMLGEYAAVDSQAEPTGS